MNILIFISFPLAAKNSWAHWWQNKISMALVFIWIISAYTITQKPSDGKPLLTALFLLSLWALYYDGNTKIERTPPHLSLCYIWVLHNTSCTESPADLRLNPHLSILMKMPHSHEQLDFCSCTHLPSHHERSLFCFVIFDVNSYNVVLKVNKSKCFRVFNQY